jgi:hypothetical protein
MECIRESCEASLSDALSIQARHSAGFMSSKACQKGMIGAAAEKTMNV